jgi:hypothetical protein
MPKEVTFPKMPESHWYALRAQFKKTMPATVDADYLRTTLGLSKDKTAINLIPTLRQLGLIDSLGKPTKRAIRWRIDTDYGEVCREIVEEVYPLELRTAFPGPEVDRTGLQEWLMKHASMGVSTARQLAATYAYLNTSTLPSSFEKRRVTNTASPDEGNRRSHSNRSSYSSADTISPQANSQVRKGKLDKVHINLEIHISPAAGAEQLEAILANMTKYLSGQ